MDFDAVRSATVALCEPLEAEDFVVQSMPDVSPTKWHLAHTTWFFETFVLIPFSKGYQRFRKGFDHLFNSYYQTVGSPFKRTRRGLLSRPTVSEVHEYRAYVDYHVSKLLEAGHEEAHERVTLGVHHEQQHQELLLMDIKHVFSINPLKPVYREHRLEPAIASPMSFESFSGGTFAVGHEGDGFSFDNETPRHDVLVQDFEIGSRCVTNGEFLEFIHDGGYDRSELWLADGWQVSNAPLYWENVEGQWHQFTLHGLQPIDGNEPVVHVSHYEADAYATWAGKRLPTEFEWELAAASQTETGTFLDDHLYHPRHAEPFVGDVWEHTRSPYAPYPGYRPLPGSLGEYNGKFMANQFVLRGASAATAKTHTRTTYRNFFYPHMQWAFMGFRLAAS